MPRAPLGEITLEYELHGPEGGRPLLLIMGIGAQLVLWPPGLLDRLAARGFRVVIFDNRDVGLSTWLDHAPVPDPRRIIPRAWLGMPVQVPYTLSDMARDAAGLLDHLDWPAAHVLGVSMGGMIAQHLAIEHPHRVRSLASAMSTTGARLHSIPQPRAFKALVSDRPRTEEAAVQWMLRFQDAVNGPAFPIDPDAVADIARRAFRRGANPPGFLRQLAAISASGDRTAALHGVRVPTVVLHGSADPLVPPAGGRATARAIPGARLCMVEGWGHSLPPGIWDTVVDEVDTTAQQAEAGTQG